MEAFTYTLIDAINPLPVAIYSVFFSASVLPRTTAVEPDTEAIVLTLPSAATFWIFPALPVATYAAPSDPTQRSSEKVLDQIVEMVLALAPVASTATLWRVFLETLVNQTVPFA